MNRLIIGFLIEIGQKEQKQHNDSLEVLGIDVSCSLPLHCLFLLSASVSFDYWDDSGMRVQQRTGHFADTA